MPATSRGSKAAASLIRQSRNPRLCDCGTASRRRQYSAAAAAAIKTPESPVQSTITSTIHPVTTSALPEYTTKSGILLSRPPILTRPLTKFETSFHFYQKRLNERLALPFTRYFYFKKDTPLDLSFKAQTKARNGSVARELGGYDAYGKQAWNDEILVGSDIDSEKSVREAAVRDAEGLVRDDGEAVGEGLERPRERYTDADVEKDVRRLDRKLARTLFLVVKGSEGWKLPSGEVMGRENLHQAAERILVQSAGVNMNTWIVGHAPVGHYINKPWLAEDGKTVTKPGEKTFFMKGRIMAGQADLKGNLFGLEDYKWLTRQEVQGAVGPKYWSWVKNMLPVR